MSRVTKTKAPRPVQANTAAKVPKAVPPKTLAQLKNLATRNPTKALLRPDLSPEAFREIVHAHIDQTWFFGKTNGLPRKPRHLLTPGAILATMEENPAWPMVMLECPDLAFDLAVLHTQKAMQDFCFLVAEEPMVARSFVFNLASKVDLSQIDEKSPWHVGLKEGFSLLSALNGAALDRDTSVELNTLQESIREQLGGDISRYGEPLRHPIHPLFEFIANAFDWLTISAESRLRTVLAMMAVRIHPTRFLDSILWPLQMERFLRCRAGELTPILGVTHEFLVKTEESFLHNADRFIESTVRRCGFFGEIPHSSTSADGVVAP